MLDVGRKCESAENHFSLAIRLQQSRMGIPPDSLVRSRAQALIKDILLTSLDIEAVISAQEDVHTRGCGDLGRALATSRALQVAFESFRHCVLPGRASLSVVLDSAEPEEHSGLALPSVEQKELLSLAKPFQVLITQAFYDKIAHYQPALRSSPVGAGVYEFLWTNEQRLNDLVATPECVLSLVSESLPPLTTVGDSAESEVPTTRLPQKELGGLPEKPGFLQRMLPAWLSSPRGVFICIAIATLILVGVVGSLITSRFSRSNRAKTFEQISPGAHRGSAPAPGGLTTNETSTSNDHKRLGGSPPQGPVRSNENWSHDQIPSKQETNGASQTAHPKLASRGRECSIGGEVSMYLNMAERSRAKGSYGEAIRQFNEVLACEPNNSVAREGVQRAKESEQLPGMR